jgi:hypothetical protein
LEGIDRVLSRLRDLGVGGVVTNVSFRDYLREPRQWDILRHGLARARELGLLVWLYDEEGYPSGAAGGLVLEGHPELEALGLACRTGIVTGPVDVVLDPPDCLRRFVGAAARDGDRRIDLAAAVDGTGRLAARLPAGSWTVRYFFGKPAYEGTHAEKNVYASRRYINVLEPAAARRFVELTHEAYARELGAGLGGARAFFTDEPSLMSSYVWPLPAGIEGKVRVQDALVSRDRSPMVAWSASFPEEFRRRAGYDILPCLDDLFADVSPRSREVREDYRAVAAALFADAWLRAIGSWCAARGVDSTGHFLVEENVLLHVAFLGDLFVLARSLSLPGIDMLDGDPRSMMAGDGFMVPKQVSSAAHLAGRRRVMSETSDWFQHNEGRTASEEEIRGATNLQFLLGVTTVASYLDWRTRGDAYARFLDYAARLSVLLTAGRHDAHVAVLYPIRSIAGRFLPQSDPPLAPTQPPDVRAVSAGWTQVCRALLTSQVDFDCIDEQGLAEGRLEHGALRVGEESYAAIVVPPADRIGARALAVLNGIAAAGGRVVVVGHPDVPPLRGLAAEGIVRVDGVDGLQAVVGHVIPRTVSLRQVSVSTLCCRHVLPSSVLYFLVNLLPSAANVEACLEESGALGIWRPESGTVEHAALYRGGDWIPVTLPGDGAAFVTIEPSSS